MWLDRVMGNPPRPGPPPRTGKGSSRAAWAKYAEALGHQIPAAATRAQIFAIVDAGPPHGPNRRALEEQIEAMATARQHRALVEACRSLADRVDRARGFDDKAWREYRLALKALREAVVDIGGPDPLDEFHSLRGTLRDSENT